MPNPKKPTEDLKGECIIPPVMPPASLPNLLYERDQHAEREIRQYVEWQARGEHVEHAERVASEFVLGRRVDAWDVYTDKRRWWVITSPTNLYSQEHFPSLDYTISFHVGLVTRMMSEPEAGVPVPEKLPLASAWRRWEQATEALEEAEEAEDFQAVGMRCRECLVAMVKSASSPEMVPIGQTSPRASDFIAWCELIANHSAKGGSAEHVRGYLKAISKSGRQLAAWLTHASSATQADAVLAVEATQQILATFGTALFRHSRGIPDRCSSGGSYKIGLWTDDPIDAEAGALPRCQACGTFVSKLA